MKLFTVLLVAAALATARAGDWNGNRPNELYDALAEDEKSFNEVQVPLLDDDAIPEYFDWCDAERNMCTSSWNQHQPQYCGSCFLHGTLHMVQDRLKIAKGGAGPDVIFGRQSFLNCAPFHGMSSGCGGGDVIDVMRYMRHHGLPDEGCLSYNATDYTKYTNGVKVEEFAGTEYEGMTCPDAGYCTNCMPDPDTGKMGCWGVKTPIKYKVVSYARLDKCGVRAMQSEILQRGPITCSMAGPTKEFGYGYSGGVYTGISEYEITGSYGNDHDVEVVGWGVDEETGVPYWKARNSWGTFWGEKGFLRLERGVNKLNIEGRDEINCDCWYAIPEFEMEEAVDAHKYKGSMFGLVEVEDSDTNDVIVQKAIANLRTAQAAARKAPRDKTLL